MPLSDEQEKIIALSKKLKNNEILSIQACAGSGKTYTLREIAKANPQKRYLYLAFNKAIVEEAKAKFPQNVEVKTLHSLALSFTKKLLGTFKLVNNLSIFDLTKLYNLSDENLIILLKEFNNFLRSDKDLESQAPTIKELFQSVLDKELPMFHNFYLKFYALQMNKEVHLHQKYDYILLDEAQDTNAVMLYIFLNNHCGKIFVGNSFQNIYAFNESLNAFKLVKPTYQTYLSQSFRCQAGILHYATFFLERFKNKDEQSVKLGSALKEQNLSQNLVYITRTNTGIIEFINEIDEKDEKKYSLLKEPDKIFSPLYAILHFKSTKLHLIPKEYAYIKNFDKA